MAIKYSVCMKFSRNNARVPKYSRGDEGIRTPDPLLARQVLSQLSYTPRCLSYGLEKTRTSDLTLIRRAL